MSARARDVLPTTVALYLMALGSVWLLDSFGAVHLGVAGMFGVAVALALIALGVLAVLAALRMRRFARRLRRAIGHVRSAHDGWAVQDAAVSTVIGDITLDLRRAELPDGETEMALLCWLGTIQVLVPAGVSVDVTAQSMIGSVDILGRSEAGFVRDVHVQTAGYDEGARRLRLRLSTFVGELFVTQSVEGG